MYEKKQMTGGETSATIFALYAGIILIIMPWITSHRLNGNYIMDGSLATRITLTLIAIIFIAMSVYNIINYRSK